MRRRDPTANKNCVQNCSLVMPGCRVTAVESLLLLNVPSGYSAFGGPFNLIRGGPNDGIFTW